MPESIVESCASPKVLELLGIVSMFRCPSCSSRAIAAVPAVVSLWESDLGFSVTVSRGAHCLHYASQVPHLPIKTAIARSKYPVASLSRCQTVRRRFSRTTYGLRRYESEIRLVEIQPIDSHAVNATSMEIRWKIIKIKK